MNTEHKLFGELHEHEEYELFGNEHKRQYEAQQEALRLSSVVVIKGTFCSCECEMPKLDGRKGLCGKCERPIVL